MKRKHLMRNRLLSSAMAVCMAVSPAVYAAAEETTAAETETAAATETETAAESETTATEGETSAETESKGGHIENLVIGTTSQPEGTSILTQQGSYGKFNYNSITYANLFYPDADNNMQPYFLDSYEISEDGCELNMTFPTDKVWHDGEPVTVDDLVFTFEYRRDVIEAKALRNLTDIKVNGEDSITLVFSQPDAYYYVKSALLTDPVLPKHIWENVDDYENYTEDDAALGCGPYRLVSEDKDAGTFYYEAVPEDSYLGELTVDSITLKSYSSQDALLMALANGEVDMMYDYANSIDYTLLDVIDGNEDVDRGESNYIGCNQVTFGMSKGANLEHDFREAVVKSLDWNLLCQICNGEYGQIPGSGILPSSCPGYDDSLWMMYQDQDEANTLLDDAGFKDVDGDGKREMPDGSKFTYKVAAQYSEKRMELFNRIGEIIASSLQEVGIDAYLDQDSLASEEVNDKMVEDNDYDLFLGYTTTGVATYRTAFWYFVPRDIAGSGAMAWGNSNTDENLANAYTALMEAKNNDEYLDAVKELQTLASNDLFAFAVCWEKCFFPYRTDKYQGFQNYPSIGAVHAETFYNLTTK